MKNVLASGKSIFQYRTVITISHLLIIGSNKVDIKDIPLAIDITIDQSKYKLFPVGSTAILCNASSTVSTAYRFGLPPP